MKKIILCIDNDALVILEFKRSLIRYYGKEVIIESSYSSLEAMSKIKESLEYHNDLILVLLSDWLQPGIKSDIFLDRIYKLYPLINYITITGQTSPLLIENLEGVSKSKFQVLRNPWSYSEMIKAIEVARGED